MNKQAYNIYAVGDAAVTVEFGKHINEAINQKVLSLFQCLKEQNIYGVKDIIPAYASVMVVYDVSLIRDKHNAFAYHFIKKQIDAIITDCDLNKQQYSRQIEIPVCYDISLGIDLEEMAAQKNISVEEIIQIHSNTIYHVYILGFLPGFAYMGKVDEKIATPRKQQPRLKIAAGSVGIAGEQTGIYPLDSPGGWNIIGQTPIKMFDALNENPTYLQAGDTVKFIPISFAEFNDLKKAYEH